MLTGMIERQLRGSLQQDWSHQALTVHVTIPGSLDGLKIPGVGLP
jgi:hypothetical protein